MGRLLASIVILIVIAVGLSFAALNSESVQVQYYVGETRAPLALVIVLALGAGAVLGVLASLGIVLTQKRRIGKLQRTVSVHEREIRNLREIPIKDRQ